MLDTRRASGAMNKDAVVTRRQYLLDARFGVILQAAALVLERVAAALQDPVWGVWLGRKSCIPAAPVFVGCRISRRGLEGDPNAHWLDRETPIEQFTTSLRKCEVRRRHGLAQRPAGQLRRRRSSGPEKRQYRHPPHRRETWHRRSQIRHS